jgi:uncharacterized protein YecA (UPF0149 family)
LQEVVPQVQLAEYPREVLRKLKGVQYTNRIEMSGKVVANQLLNQIRWKTKETEYLLPFRTKLETREFSLASATGEAHFDPESWSVRLHASPESYFRIDVKAFRKTVVARLLHTEVR